MLMYAITRENRQAEKSQEIMIAKFKARGDAELFLQDIGTDIPGMTYRLYRRGLIISLRHS